MNYREASASLSKSYSVIKPQHDERGHIYIKEHWARYIGLLTLLPPLSKNTRVLEVGASILSAHLHMTYGCPLTVIYHELESEWSARFSQPGITAFPLEMMRDPLPVKDDSFDLILFDEVMEHFPLHPAFVMRQFINKLAGSGELFLSVPNFATSEKRIQLLLGKNPQDVMDERFVYYAHHREPVMQESIRLVQECGGLVFFKKWLELDGDPAVIPLVKRHVFHLFRGRFHPFLHFLFPSTRRYIVIRAHKKPSHYNDENACLPPLSISAEYARSRP
jgi:SAM-dependent methyltransferase